MLKVLRQFAFNDYTGYYLNQQIMVDFNTEPKLGMSTFIPELPSSEKTYYLHPLTLILLKEITKKMDKNTYASVFTNTRSEMTMKDYLIGHNQEFNFYIRITAPGTIEARKKEFLKDFKTHPQVNDAIDTFTEDLVKGIYFNDKAVIIYLNYQKHLNTRAQILALTMAYNILPTENQNEKIDGLFYELKRAFVDRQSDAFIKNIILDYVEQNHLYIIDKQAILTKLLKSDRSSLLFRAQERVDSCREEVVHRRSYLTDGIAALNEAIIKLNALENQVDGNEEDMAKEILEFAETAKTIKNIEVSACDEQINLTLLTSLKASNPDAWLDGNERLFSGLQTLKELLDLALTTDAFTLNSFAEIRVQIPNSSFNTNRRFEPDYDAIPNPHLQRFGCFGTYEEPICDALERKDYLLAFELFIGAASRINPDDSAVVNKLVDFLQNHPDHRCFINNSTGELFSYNDYKERIKEENEAFRLETGIEL